MRPEPGAIDVDDDVVFPIHHLSGVARSLVGMLGIPSLGFRGIHEHRIGALFPEEQAGFIVVAKQLIQQLDVHS
ncbi:hypothetical protein D3C78_1434850 [compost metagenome]